MSAAIAASEQRKRVAGSMVRSETPPDEDQGEIEAEQEIHGASEAVETYQQQEKKQEKEGETSRKKGDSMLCCTV